MSLKAKSSSDSLAWAAAQVYALLGGDHAVATIGKQDHARAGQQQVAGLHDLDQPGGEFTAEGRAHGRAQAEQSVDAFCLPRSEDVGRHQPGLRYRDDAEQAHPDVEDVEHPAEIEAQHPPDHHQADHGERGCPVHRRRQGNAHHHPGVDIPQDSAHDGDQHLENGQLIDIEFGQEECLRNGLQDVVCKQDTRHVQRHEQSPHSFPRANIVHASPEKPDGPHNSVYRYYHGDVAI